MPLVDFCWIFYFSRELYINLSVLRMEYTKNKHYICIITFANIWDMTWFIANIIKRCIFIFIQDFEFRSFVDLH